LNAAERKTAFKELQDLYKDEAGAGSSANRTDQQAEGLLSWNGLDAWKRKTLFEELQVSCLNTFAEVY
jgi:hypothetical protein